MDASWKKKFNQLNSSVQGYSQGTRKSRDFFAANLNKIIMNFIYNFHIVFFFSGEENPEDLSDHQIHKKQKKVKEIT